MSSLTWTLGVSDDVLLAPVYFPIWDSFQLVEYVNVDRSVKPSACLLVSCQTWLISTQEGLALWIGWVADMVGGEISSEGGCGITKP